MSGYVVLDFETTGFSPAKLDRVVEVGVVEVDARGAIERHWGTLINPERDMGATHVHGITAADVFAAPTFRDVAPRLLASMAGRTVVAHNARFDMTFLTAELARAGYPVHREVPCLCTMEWSSRFLHGTSRKLGDCCRLAGVIGTSRHERPCFLEQRTQVGTIGYANRQRVLALVQVRQHIAARYDNAHGVRPEMLHGLEITSFQA